MLRLPVFLTAVLERFLIPMLVAEGAVEIRVLRRQGETARWSGVDSN